MNEIRMSAETDKIMPALLAARRAMGAGEVGKNSKNAHFNYTYANLESYFDLVNEQLLANGLILVQSVADASELPPFTTKKGEHQNYVRVILSSRLIHESGQWIESYSCGAGVDAGDKSDYKAITGARKYGVAGILWLVTSDDPEIDNDTDKAGGSAGRASRPSSPPAAAEDLEKMGEEIVEMARQVKGRDKVDEYLSGCIAAFQTKFPDAGILNVHTVPPVQLRGWHKKLKGEVAGL